MHAVRTEFTAAFLRARSVDFGFYFSAFLAGLALAFGRLLRGPAPGLRVAPRRRRGGGRGIARLGGGLGRRFWPRASPRVCGPAGFAGTVFFFAGDFAGRRAVGFFFFGGGGPLPEPARSRARSSRSAFLMGSS